MKRNHLIFTAFLLLIAGNAKAQLESSYPSPAVLYKVLVDDPAMQNRIWLHLQPVTCDAMGMNAVVGSGLETHWISPFRGMELHGSIRGNFFNAMDLQKKASGNAAVFFRNTKYDDPVKMAVNPDFSRFLAWEAGAFYPVLETTRNGKANIAVPDQSGQADNLELNAKVMRILGARLGFSSMQSTVSLNQALEDQNIELTGSRGTRLSSAGATQGPVFRTENGVNSLFSTFSSSGFYAGVALQRKKNLSIKTETLGIISSNSILSFYADLLVNPWTNLRPFTIGQAGAADREEFKTGQIALNKLGFRTGFEVRYNESPFLSAGAELGYRPSVQGQGFYAALRIGVPVFSVGNRSFTRPSTNVGADQSIGK